MSIGNRHSQHSFAQIPSVNIQRSTFDRSFGIKDTIGFDKLYPVFVDEIIPGDTCNVNVQAFARLATQKVPIMDNLFLDFFFFFVPCRLVWENWERFMGAQPEPDDPIDFVIPEVAMPATITGTIWDKLGVPPTAPTGYLVNALIPRCYNLIYNDWFRDQNLQFPLVVQKDDGPDVTANYFIVESNKKHDYFASALPWTQKGDPASISIGEAPVTGIGIYQWQTPQALNTVRETDGTASINYASAWGAISWQDITPANPQSYLVVENDTNNTGFPNIRATVPSPTVNALREAFQIQGLLELDARGGTRYVEILQNHYGVTSPDFRLQRPEFLGGGTSQFNIHPIPQTSATAVGAPQANLAAFGTVSAEGSRIGFSKSFVEHGYVIGLARARALITYQAGINRMWKRSTRYDFFFPKLQQLSEQAVYNYEIYVNPTPIIDEDAFGYQERYAEYRYRPSEIHGLFNSYADTGTPIDQWHMAQEFAAAPELNDEFMYSSTPIERAMAVTTEPPIILDVFYRYRHARPMMTYSVPATLGRF